MVRYVLIEWDCDNGEVVSREYLDVSDAEEAFKVLESVVEDAEKNGWVCNETGNGDFICSKLIDGYAVTRQLLIEEV